MRQTIAAKALVLLALLLLLAPHDSQAADRRPIRVKSGDGTVLSGTFFDSRAVGPGALFFQDCSGDPVELFNLAAKITAAGPRVLIWDYRKGANPKTDPAKVAEDAQAAWRTLVTQARVGADVVGLVSIGCGARSAIPFAAKTGKVKLMVFISPDLEGITDEQLAAVAELPMLIYAADDEPGAKRLFAATHHEKSQLKLYRRSERGMDLYLADKTLKNGIDDFFEFVYGSWSRDDF